VDIVAISFGASIHMSSVWVNIGTSESSSINFSDAAKPETFGFVAENGDISELAACRAGSNVLNEKGLKAELFGDEARGTL
jgi:hypothetical protein